MTTANSSGLQIEADRLRKSVHVITIGEADGDDVVVAGNDIVRIKIGRLGKAPILEIASDVATAEGSICTAANPTELTLMGADLSFQTGIYDIDATIYDTSVGKAKKVENGVFILRESMLGDLA